MTDYIRLLNCVIAAGCVAAMTAGLLIRRHKLTRRVRRISWVFHLFLVNIAYGSGYLYSKHDIPINPPTVTTMLILCILVIALIWHPDGDDKLPPDDGALTNRFMVWFDGWVRSTKARHQPPATRRNHD